MEFKEEDFLQLSGIQHFAFCRRQWALIHIEQQWSENLRTVEGKIFHQRAHDGAQRESRGDLRIVRDLHIHSCELGISGSCDVVEFRRSAIGIPLNGTDGLWQVYPVEYKRGAPKPTDVDRLQLCAQAMCLEEMLCCEIGEAALFYGETRHREIVTLDAGLREQVRSMFAEMHELCRRSHTPKVKPGRGCSACSLREICLPKLAKVRSVKSYLQKSMEDAP